MSYYHQKSCHTAIRNHVILPSEIMSFCLQKSCHTTFGNHVILPSEIMSGYLSEIMSDYHQKSWYTAFRNHVILPSEIMSHSFRNQVFLLLKINHVASTLENILPFKVMSYTQSVCVPLSRNYTLSNSLI